MNRSHSSGYNLLVSLSLAVSICALCIFTARFVSSTEESCVAEDGSGNICRNWAVCEPNKSCRCWPGFIGEDCSTETTCESVQALVSHVDVLKGAGRIINFFGDYVTYTCKYGYQLEDVNDTSVPVQRTVRCNEDGKWGPDLADCKALCPVIPTWRGYKLSTTLRKSDTRLFYGCEGEYGKHTGAAYGVAPNKRRYMFIDQATNEKIAFCKDGKWIPPIVRCMDLQYYKMSSSVKSNMLDRDSAKSLMVVFVILSYQKFTNNYYV